MVPEVSIVIPVFQDQAGLNRCLDSIAQQEDVVMSDLEVVVVDNGSESRITVPRNLPYAVRLLFCEKKGAYSARNVGASAVSGKVLAFLDADCWPSQTWLRSGIEALRASKGLALIGGHVLFECSLRPAAVECYQVLMGFGQERSVNELGFSATANLFVMREVFDRVGWFNEILLSGGDREWSWRAAQEGVPARFSEKSIVWTCPRRTLRGALLQARRVAGGRRILGGDPAIVKSVGSERIRPKKGIVGKAKTILCARQFSLRQRALIFGVAIIIRIVHDAEVVRIRMGSQPERR